MTKVAIDEVCYRDVAGGTPLCMPVEQFDHHYPRRPDMHTQRRLVAAVALALLATLGAATTSHASIAKASQTSPVIYLVPHQDDETLSMAADIRAHVKAGRRVILVMVTRGDATGAWRPTMPLCASFGICLDSMGVISARNREYRAAAADLGIRYQDMHWEGLHDGRLTQTQANQVITKWVKRYPHASFKTMSWLDDHPDHQALAYALRNVCQRHMIANDDCRFLEFSRYWTSKPVTGGYDPGDEQVVAAMGEYTLFDPDHLRYAIGGQFSVPGDFARMASSPIYQQSKWHTMYVGPGAVPVKEPVRTTLGEG